MTNTQLLIIDPQGDFCSPKGSLFVGGAEQDSIRLSDMIIQLKPHLDDIHVTLDTHHYVSIFHSVFWMDGKGIEPGPFTIITEDDVKNGRWRAKVPVMQKWAEHYTQQLAVNKRYALCIWPYHCLIGTPGHNVIQPIATALAEWEQQFANVDYVTKGSNFKTEHYSAVQADVEDPTDPTTQLNMGLIQTLETADVLLLSGQALSHCVNYTVSDIADNFGEENIRKMVMIEDTTSSVANPPGMTIFSDAADKFMSDMKARGMQTCRAADVSLADIGTFAQVAAS